MSRVKLMRLVVAVVLVGLAAVGLQACAPATVSTSPNPANELPAPPDDGAGN